MILRFVSIQVTYVSDLAKEAEFRRIMQLAWDSGRRKCDAIPDPTASSARSITPSFSDAPPTPNQVINSVRSLLFHLLLALSENVSKASL